MQLEVNTRGNNAKTISLREGENVLTVNLQDWWDMLTKGPELAFASNGSMMEVGEYPNIFTSHHPEQTFPLFDREEAKEFQENIREWKAMGNKLPIIKGRLTHDAKSHWIFNDGFISGI